MYSTVINHFDWNDVLCDEQHGLWAHRSCETQLVITLDQIDRSMGKRYQTDIILLKFP